MNPVVEDDSLEKNFITPHLRDFKLAIEFKHLMKHAPGGVFIVPELDNIRVFHGIIFVRKGLYKDGIFRFTMSLPPEYNSANTYPEIFFTPPIFNPLVNPMTGYLNLKQDEKLKDGWISDRHFILTSLQFLKKIFYMKNYDSFEIVSNEVARNYFDKNHEQYLELVQDAVKLSIQNLHNEQPDNCTLIFTDPKPCHDILRTNLLGENSCDDEISDDEIDINKYV